MESMESRKRSLRDSLIERHGREKIRLWGGSTFLINSEPYKHFRQANNKQSYASRKKKRARERLENFFVMSYLRNSIEKKKKLNQEITNLKAQNDINLETIERLKNLLMELIILLSRYPEMLRIILADNTDTLDTFNISQTRQD